MGAIGAMALKEFDAATMNYVYHMCPRPRYTLTGLGDRLFYAILNLMGLT